MSYLRGPDRSEVQLLPGCLDDYVAPNAPARFIEAFIENLDLKELGFARAQPADTGRPGYHPADLLKLYLYGYLQRVRSSRRLEAEAMRNLELMWLLRGLRPDFKTIADFRKDNLAAFKSLFRQFNLLCRKLGLFAAELVAIDGSKFKAVNNIRRHFTQDQVNELIQKVEGRIEEYLAALDQQDAAAAGVPAAPKRQALQEKIALLQALQGPLRRVARRDENQRPEEEISLTDPDSRKVKGAHGAYLVGYNVQVAVDDKHDLIVVQDVVAIANDLNQLAPMATAAKAELKVPSLQAVADTGYHAAAQLETCEQVGVETFVAASTGRSGQGPGGQAIFPPEKFACDPAADTYRCPSGQTLARAGQKQKHGKTYGLYHNPEACRACPLRGQCTTRDHRIIARRNNQAVVERAAARLAAHPEKMAARKEIVEHVFGTLRIWHHDTFLLRGLDKVRAEFSLSALVYNLRRVLNLVKMTDLLKAVAAPSGKRA